MRIACDQKTLNQNLSLVLRAVPSKPTHPILGNILVTADRNTQQITLIAFDLSLGIETSFPAQVQDDGKTTLPAKLFVDIISRLPDGELTLENDNEEEPVVTITSSSGRYQVRGMTWEDYPDLPEVEGEVVNLPNAALLEGLKGTLFATSPDETKQVLTGVHLKLEKDTLEFASTDGHRLAVVKTTNEPEEDNNNEDEDKVVAENEADEDEDEAVDEDEDEAVDEDEDEDDEAVDEDDEDEDDDKPVKKDSKKKQKAEKKRPLNKVKASQRPKISLPNMEFEVTVPSKALRELEKMLGMRQPSDLVALRSDEGQIIFELANQKILSRTLEGQYPNYRQLVPRQFERQITIERKPLLNALERIAILANQKNDIVKVSIDSEKQQLLLSVDAKDIGNATESLSATISGDDLELAFNVKYAMESLKNIAASEITIQLNSATNPVVFSPLGGTRLTHLLMPVQLRN